MNIELILTFYHECSLKSHFTKVPFLFLTFLLTLALTRRKDVWFVFIK